MLINNNLNSSFPPLCLRLDGMARIVILYFSYAYMNSAIIKIHHFQLDLFNQMVWPEWSYYTVLFTF